MSKRQKLTLGMLRGGPDPSLSPKCRPCQEDDHGRCATALAENGIFDSDYNCRCFREDEIGHNDAFDRNQFHHELRDTLSDMPGPGYWGKGDY